MSNETAMVGRPVQDLDTPALLVDLTRLERNIDRAAGAFKAAGVNWRPHAKGQKVPAIAHMEIAAGAIGITCAKLGEAEVMVSAGINSILIANQIVGPQKVTRLANLCRRAEVIVAVDSVKNALELDAAGRKKGVCIPVVVELDTGMGRCGVQPGEPALALSRQLHDLDGLRFVGLMSWEGHVRGFPDPEARRAACEQAVRLLTGTARRCREEGLPVEVVSCGGTGTHMVSAGVPGVTEIQAGGIVFNDGYYSGLGLDHDFALTVLSTVVSRPTPTLIVTDAGCKTMSQAAALPRPLGIAGVKSVGLSAEHGRIALEEPSSALEVGDKVTWIVGYADTTVCLHDEMFGIRDGVTEAVWPILARGKLR